MRRFATFQPTLATMLALLYAADAGAVRPPETTFLGMEPVRVHQFDADTQAYWAAQDAWRAFAEAEGAGWQARFDQLTGTPHRMWGPGLDLGPVSSEAEVSEAVLAFIDRHADTLGVDGAELRVKQANYVKSMDAWYVDVDTLRTGLPIWRGGVTLRLKQGRLTMVGADTYPNTPVVGEAKLTRAQAIRASIQQGHARQAEHTRPAAELMLLPIEAAGRLTLRTVWRTESRTEAPLGHWVSFVDAETGELLDVYNEVRFFEGQVSGEHDVRLGNGATEVSPLPNARISSSTDSVYSDSDGVFELPDASSYSLSLDGAQVRVFDQLGAVEPNFTPAEQTILYADDFGGRLAPSTTYVYVQRAQAWAMAIAPEVSWSDARVRAYVNIDDACNAWFDGDLNFLRSGSGCSNTGRLADVIYHEWGHGFHTYSIQSGFYDGSLGEGAADAISFLLTDDSRIAPYFYSRGGTLRNVDNNQRYPDDFTPGEQAIHFNGLIFGGSLWDTREALRDTYGEPTATEITSEILSGILKGGPDIETSYEEALFADDDDGDLGNGTPHQCELIDGFGRHGLGPQGGQGIAPIHQPVVEALPDVDTPIDLSLVSPAPQCFDIKPLRGTVHYRVNGGIWRQEPLSVDDVDVRGVLPAGKLGDFYEYWVKINAEGGTAYLSPTGGEIRPHTFYVGDVLQVRCDTFDRNDGAYTHELISGTADEGADDWQWGPPAGAGGDPSEAYSGNNVWGNDLGGSNYNGQYQNEKHNRLTSKVYNTSHYKGTFLRYQRWLQVEDGFYDRATIMADGEVVWSNWRTNESNGVEHHLDDAWAEHVVDIGAAGDDGSVQFSWDIQSDQGLAFGGWTIDDVCIYAPATADNRLGINDFDATPVFENGPVVLSWTHPKHDPLEKVTLVRKVGSYPTDPSDGQVIWEVDDPELGQPVAITDPISQGRKDLFYAVYASDGTEALSWTIEGMNADSVRASEGASACGCQQGAPSGWWMASLGLLLLGRRRDPSAE